MKPQDNHLYEFESFVVDAGRRVLLKDGAVVRLNPKAFDTLLVLVQNAVRTVEKEQLLNEVWPDSFVEEGSLSRNIHELRKALGDESSEPRYIKTVPKRGYRFVSPVKVTEADGDQFGLTSIEGDATLIERHAFARVISKEFEGGELTSRLEQSASAAGNETPALSDITGKRRRRSAAVLVTLLLAGAIGLFVLLKRAPISSAPIPRATRTLVRLTNK